MYTPENLLAELRSDRVSQKAVDIASILFLVTSYMYNNSDSPTVQPDNTEDMDDFSYLPFDGKLRIRETKTDRDNRVLLFSYYNPVSEVHEVSSIVYGTRTEQGGCLVPYSYLGYRELQKLESSLVIPYADITGLTGHNDYPPLQATLCSGSIMSEQVYSRYVPVSQLADILEKMLEIGEDFYDISPTVSYIGKQYDNRLM